MHSVAKLTFHAEGIEVTLRVNPGKDGWVATVRFNPSEWTDNPDPLAALPITSLCAAVSAVWNKTLEFATPRVALAEAKVTRIDVARDFRVEAAGQVALMEALHKLPVPYAYSRPLYNSHRGVPESLYIGTATEGTVRAYDRHSKDSLIPAGTLRVEVEARKNWAKRYGGMETAADLGPSTITDLFTDRFRWAKLDHPVVYESARLQHLWNLAQDPDTPGITTLAVVRFAGVERLQQAGIDARQGTTATSTGNAIRTALGVPHGSPEAPTCFRLDPAYDEPLVAA